MSIAKYQACECEEYGRIRCWECCYLPGSMGCEDFIEENECEVIE